MPRERKRQASDAEPKSTTLATTPATTPKPNAAPEEALAEAPVARSIWSGSISFGLVTVPVELYSATQRRGVSLRMLGPDGAPLAREYVCPAEDRALADDEIERGWEVRDGEFVLVSDEELEALAPRRSRDIELTRFVDRAAIDPAWFVRPYFLIPDAEQTKAYRLLAETMEASGRAALAHFVLRGKAHPLAIFADQGLLRAETLRFGDELRSAADLDLPEPGEVDDERVARMRRAIESLAADALDEAELVDDGARRLRAIAERKRERGEDVVEAPAAGDAAAPAAEGEPEEGGELIDLLGLLRERLRDAPAARPKRAAQRGDGGGLQEESKRALLERAKELDIPGRSRMSRDELIASIRRAS